jgi:hypothetical protein
LRHPAVARQRQNRAAEVWSNNRMRVHFSTVIRIGDYVYGSSGDWPRSADRGGHQERQNRLAGPQLPKANSSTRTASLSCWMKTARWRWPISPQGLKVFSRAALLGSNAWTVPSLAGGRLYLRDRNTLMALTCFNRPAALEAPATLTKLPSSADQFVDTGVPTGAEYGTAGISRRDAHPHRR